MNRGRNVRLLSPVLWAFVVALAVRVLLPGGTMLASGETGGPTVVLCTGSGPVEAVFQDGKVTPVKHAPAAPHEHGACPFAGGHVFTPSAALAAPPSPLNVQRREPDPAPPAARAAALRLRAPPPPSHAPPLRLA
jgi:hypothetical protein